MEKRTWNRAIKNFLVLYHEPNENPKLPSSSIGFSPKFFNLSKKDQKRFIIKFVKYIHNDIKFSIKATYTLFTGFDPVYKNVKLDDYHHTTTIFNFSYNVLVFLFFTWKIQELYLNDIKQKLQNNELKISKFFNLNDLLFVLGNRVLHGIKQFHFSNILNLLINESLEVEAYTNLKHINDIFTSSTISFRDAFLKDHYKIFADRIFFNNIGRLTHYLVRNYKLITVPEPKNIIRLIKHENEVTTTFEHLTNYDVFREYLKKISDIHRPSNNSIQIIWSFVNIPEDIRFKHLFFGKEYIEEVIKNEYNTDDENIILLGTNKYLYELLLIATISLITRHDKTRVKIGLGIGLSSIIQHIKLYEQTKESPIIYKKEKIIPGTNVKHYEDTKTSFALNKNTSFIKYIIKHFSEIMVSQLYKGIPNEIKTRTIFKLENLIYETLPNNLFYDSFETLKIWTESLLTSEIYIKAIVSSVENWTDRHNFMRLWRDIANYFSKLIKEKFASKHLAQQLWIEFIANHIVLYYMTNLLRDEELRTKHIEALKQSGLSARIIAGPFYKIFAKEPNKGPKEYIKTHNSVLSLIEFNTQVKICATIIKEDPNDPVVNAAIIQSTQDALTQHPEDPCPSINMLRQAINRERERKRKEEEAKALEKVNDIVQWLEQAEKRSETFYSEFDLIMAPINKKQFPNHSYKLLRANQENAKFIVIWSKTKRTCLFDTIIHSGHKFVASVMLLINDNDKSIERVIGLSDYKERFFIKFREAYTINPITEETELVLEDDIKDALPSRILREHFYQEYLFEGRFLKLESKYYCTDYNNRLDTELFEYLTSFLFPATRDAYEFVEIIQTASQNLGKPVFFRTSSGLYGCPYSNIYCLAKPYVVKETN